MKAHEEINKKNAQSLMRSYKLNRLIDRIRVITEEPDSRDKVIVCTQKLWKALVELFYFVDTPTLKMPQCECAENAVMIYGVSIYGDDNFSEVCGEECNLIEKQFYLDWCNLKRWEDLQC